MFNRRRTRYFKFFAFLNNMVSFFSRFFAVITNTGCLAQQMVGKNQKAAKYQITLYTFNLSRTSYMV